MAVETRDTHSTTPGAPNTAGGRRFLVGSNVIVATVLVVGIAAVAQVIAYNTHRRWDMTSSGINSLSEGTENLLRHLDTNIRLTSLYFETDREEEDQSRYRQAAEDLLQLYEATNRAKVTYEWVNPLKDHERFRKLVDRLREKPAFNDELDAYRQRIERYTTELDETIRQLVQADLAKISSIGAQGWSSAAPDGAASGRSPAEAVFAPIQNVLSRWSDALAQVRERVDALMLSETPQYTAVVNELRNAYRDLSKSLKEIGQFGKEQATRAAGLSDEQTEFLETAGSRYADLVAKLDAELTKLQDLEPPKFDDLVNNLLPTANAILVETDADATVVDFASVWPPVRQGAVRSGFDDRAFKGEEKVTSAILRATHKEQTAAVFVRYGGGPLFAGGFMPNQPPAPYAQMKMQLEDANFIVSEWDVKTADSPPPIEPTPTKTIYVLLKPEPPQRGPMGQPGQEPPFGDKERRAVLDAIGESGRALFIAGWHQGPFGLMPGSYEYNQYLEDTWGIRVVIDVLLLQATSIEPGRYAVTRRDFFIMQDLETTDHDIVSSALTRELGLPLCAPLELTEPPPDEVAHFPLVIQPKIDGLWGVKDVQGFIERAQSREDLTKEPDDLEGPMTLAAAATKGDKKIVVISSAEFAVDNVAFAQALVPTARGFVVRSRNPGNISLLINSLHWLNDNTQFMNIGRPIESAVLQIPNPSTVRMVKGITIFVWPLMALACGGVAWWIRRR